MLSQGGRRRARAAGVRGMGRARAPRLPARTALLCGIFGAAAGAGCGERPRGGETSERERAEGRECETREITCDLVRFKENKPHE